MVTIAFLSNQYSHLLSSMSIFHNKVMEDVNNLIKWFLSNNSHTGQFVTVELCSMETSLSAQLAMLTKLTNWANPSCLFGYIWLQIL